MRSPLVSPASVTSLLGLCFTLIVKVCVNAEEIFFLPSTFFIFIYIFLFLSAEKSNQAGGGARGGEEAKKEDLCGGQTACMLR